MMVADTGERGHQHGDTDICANCGQPIVFRFPKSHVKGFWTHADGLNRDGRESFDSTCDLKATPDSGSKEPSPDAHV